MKRLVFIDYLRGFSIFTIVLMHLIQNFYKSPGWLASASSFGGAGVHIFIFCSGLGLYLSYLKKPLNYGEFLKKRLLKVYFPYIIAVMAWSVWYTCLNGIFPLKEFLSHVFLYKMFFVSLDSSLCVAYWFISMIFQFYLCWPLIVKVMSFGKIGGGIALIVSCLYSILIVCLELSDERVYSSFFLQYLWEFCLGMWIALYLYTHEEFYKEMVVTGKWITFLKWRYLLPFCLLCLIADGVMGLTGGFWKSLNDIPSFFAYSSCLIIVYKLGIKWVNQFFICTSSFSYELYLVHWLVFAILLHYFPNINWIVSFPLCLVFAYLVSYAYYKVRGKLLPRDSVSASKINSSF